MRSMRGWVKRLGFVSASAVLAATSVAVSAAVAASAPPLVGAGKCGSVLLSASGWLDGQGVASRATDLIRGPGIAAGGRRTASSTAFPPG